MAELRANRNVLILWTLALLAIAMVGPKLHIWVNGLY